MKKKTPQQYELKQVRVYLKEAAPLYSSEEINSPESAVRIMPFVGLSLILRRGNGPVTRFLGLTLLLVSIAAWGYLVDYSIRRGSCDRPESHC